MLLQLSVGFGRHSRFWCTCVSPSAHTTPANTSSQRQLSVQHCCQPEPIPLAKGPLIFAHLLFLLHMFTFFCVHLYLVVVYVIHALHRGFLPGVGGPDKRTPVPQGGCPVPRTQGVGWGGVCVWGGGEDKRTRTPGVAPYPNTPGGDRKCCPDRQKTRVLGGFLYYSAGQKIFLGTDHSITIMFTTGLG